MTNMKKKIMGAVGIFLLWMAITWGSMFWFHSGSWVGVCFAHVVLTITDKNMCHLAAWTYLTKDIQVTLADLIQQGWTILEHDDSVYLLQRDGKYKNVILDDVTITGYEIVIVSDEFDERPKNYSDVIDDL